MAKDHPRFGLLYAWKRDVPPRAILGRGPGGQKRRVRPVLAMPVGGSPPLRYEHEPGRWVACDYAVRPPILEDILGKLGFTPEGDAFATEENKRFEKLYGKGSPDGETAFEKTWGSEVLWINPLFNAIPRVLDKIVADMAHAGLIVPYW